MGTAQYCNRVSLPFSAAPATMGDAAGAAEGILEAANGAVPQGNLMGNKAGPAAVPAAGLAAGPAVGPAGLAVGDAAPVVTGMVAADVYEFYTILNGYDAVTLARKGRIRPGPYTGIRQHCQLMGFDGEQAAIEREEHLSGKKWHTWPAPKLWITMQQAGERLAACLLRLAAWLFSVPRIKGSKYLVRIDFTPLGYAHFRHLGDLRQSWQNWWRLYGDICSCCQDSKNQVLYRAHVVKAY